MRLAYHGATSMKADLATDVRASAAAGFSALEVWAAKLDAFLATHSLAELRTMFDTSGVKPTAINSIEFIGFRGPGFAAIRERCKRLCESAEAVGCGSLVVVPSPTPTPEGGSVLELFFPWPRVVEEYVRVLRELADIARPHGVRLAFEFLGFSWCSVRTPRAAWEIVRAVDRPNVGINFDCCHFFGGGAELREIDGLDPAGIVTFHLNDMEDVCKEAITDDKRLLPGEGVIPLGAICHRMKAIGYDGVCAVELFRPEYWAWDPMELAKRAKESAIDVLAPYFNIVTG
jgi:2-keto-myo-inositol isomerase